MLKKYIPLVFTLVLYTNMSSCSEEYPLHEAAAAGNFLQVHSMLSVEGPGNVPVNTRDNYQRTPLHRAASSGHLDVVKLLVEHSANVHAAEKYGYSPLHAAAEGGHTAVVQYLCSVGAHVNAQDLYQTTPVFLASEHGLLETVKILVKNNADTSIQDAYGMTPLAAAAENDHLDVVSFLVESEAGITTRFTRDSTLLHNALPFPHISNYLIAMGVPITLPNGTIDRKLIKSAIECFNAPVFNAAAEAFEDLAAALYEVDNAGKSLIDKSFESVSEVGAKYWTEKAKINAVQIIESLIKFGIFFNKEHKEVLETEHQALLRYWSATATAVQKQKMLEQPRPVYQKWIEDEKERLLSQDLQGTYVESLPRDVQGLLLEFVVSQTPKPDKRKSEADSRDDEVQSTKKRRTE